MNDNLKTCPKCNTVNGLDAKFCRSCGEQFILIGSKPDETEPVKQETPETEQQVEFSAASAQSGEATVLDDVDEAFEPVQPVENNAVEAEVPPMYNTPEPQPTGGYNPPPYQNYAQPVRPDYSQGYQQPGSNPQPNYNYNYNGKIQGVDERELAVYVGAGSDKYIKKFRKYQAGAKVTWNWPVFLFSLLISPVVAGFWFLHRKMNKIGAIVIAIGMVLTIAVFGVVGAMLSDMGDVTASNGLSSSNSIPDRGSFSADGNYFDDFLNDYDNKYDYDDYFDDYGSYSDEAVQYGLDIAEVVLKYIGWLMLLGFLELAMIIILPLFANKWYLDDAVSKINTIKQTTPPENWWNAIAMQGGTNATYWVICMVVFVIAVMAATTIMATSFAAAFLGGLKM